MGISQDKLNCQTCEGAVLGKTGEKNLRHVRILFSLNGYLRQLRPDYHTNRLDVGGEGLFFLCVKYYSIATSVFFFFKKIHDLDHS